MGIFRSIFTVAHVVIVLLLGATMLNAYIPPKVFPLLNLLSLAFPFLMIANLLLCFFWIFSWHYGFFGLSVILMLVLLISLIRISDLLSKEKLTNIEKAFVRVPFSVYFGWITVATIANITAFLVSVSWNGFGIAEEIWTIIILLVGAGIGIARTLKDKNIAYGLVLVWAYFGIWIKHTSPTGFNGQYPGVITTIIVCIFLFIAALGFVAYSNFKKPVTNDVVSK